MTMNLILRTVTFAGVIGGLAFSLPLHAAVATDLSQPPALNQPTPSAKKTPHSESNMERSPQAAQERVEDRIKTLYAKLEITNQQESKWNEVAQVMRENEVTMSQLIQERHQNPDHRTAIEDLQSYEKLAQAHVDGLQKLIPVFQVLYNDMSDEQRQKADDAFGRFEGHRGAMSASKRN